MLKPSLSKLVCGIVAVSCLAVLAGQLIALADIQPFEWRPLYSLIGLTGVAALLVVNLGVVALAHHCMAVIRSRPTRWPRITGLLCALSVLMLLWAADWMFRETPLTMNLTLHRAEDRPVTLLAAQRKDFGNFSIATRIKNSVDRERLATMYERIRLVNPRIYDTAPLGRTIDMYAQRYDVDPVVLFSLAYVHSFWGEATSGRVPFLRHMTAETIRDLVQIHLPAWFVESPVRRLLITSGFFPALAGDYLGSKLRYALHKATLDVSAQPYELNMLSDVILVLREFPQEFEDLLGPGVTDPVKVTMRESYFQLREHALLRPYENPYAVPARDRQYYVRHRVDFKRFARAAYYATVLDFDLATRIAALLIVYQRGVYIDSLGRPSWSQLPDFQTTAMLLMTRDVFVPNIGRLGYNLYALPEMNCVPVAFVASRARDDPALTPGPVNSLWRPKDYALLWGGAGTKLRVASEVWSVVYGQPFPGLAPEDSVRTARSVVLLQQSH